METKSVHPSGHRHRRIAYHQAHARKLRSIRAAKYNEQYHYSGVGSVTVLLAIAALSFGLFMYSMVIG
ncbi:MAG: hypothetical protein AB1458_12430 [Bacteroidota bacterium]